MGLEIEKSSFTEQEFRSFHRRLDDNLEALRLLLDRKGFGKGPASIGAELELYIVDRDGHPLARNCEILEQVADPQLTLELNRYNLEYNLTPVPARGTPFAAIETEILAKLDALEQVAVQHQGHILAIGILPTLRRRDFGPQVMSGQRRYQALSEGLARIRGERFTVRINGAEPISLRARDVTLEGANTSMQLHYRVAPQGFADIYNAIQLATPVALALASNSPFMLGQRLWQETRIPLFKHAIDGSTRDCHGSKKASRVGFGNGWVRDGAYELFAESVLLHPPILPVCQDGEDALAQVQAGNLPALRELRLHHGTVWSWNRVIYDDAGEGHLRIEMRALPAGPSACDMMANAAFLIGLGEGLRTQVRELLPALPFPLLSYNFYRAAEHGINARLLWPSPSDRRLVELPIAELARQLLPLADQGLARIGVRETERQHYLGIIDTRLRRSRTGAVWQLEQVSRLSRRLSRHRALRAMLEHYRANASANLPVAEWADIR